MRHWAEGYLDAFHAASPGITERVLARSRAEGSDPYRWCAAAFGRTGGLVVDLACGSGPLAAHLPAWIGLDTSDAELAAAAALERGPLAKARANQLPLPDRSLSSVVCSMALQVTEPLPAVLAEIARVLRPGGRLVALLPTSPPLRSRDALLYLRLQAALQRRITYPNTSRLRPAALAKAAEAAGLSVTGDERRAFVLPLRTEADVRELVASLYLPEVAPERLDRALKVLNGRIGRDLPIPLRRIVMHRNASTGSIRSR